jgi:hypothetical protein
MESSLGGLDPLFICGLFNVAVSKSDFTGDGF